MRIVVEVPDGPVCPEIVEEEAPILPDHVGRPNRIAIDELMNRRVAVPDLRELCDRPIGERGLKKAVEGREGAYEIHECQKGCHFKCESMDRLGGSVVERVYWKFNFF
jgi:hypothetical protein